MTRRALVLTDEAARHPFLSSLPPHVRQGTEPAFVRIIGGSRWRLILEDARQFLGTYCACFLAVVTFFG